MEHQGASSTGTYYRSFEVSCIYSGNTRKYSVSFEPNGKTMFVTAFLMIWCVVSLSGVSSFLYYRF